MNWLDIVLGIPLLWLLYKGFKNGFVIELASLAALILGIFVALHFSFYAENYLRESFEIGERYLYIVSFAITFLVVAIVVVLAGKIIDKLINIVALGLLNRLLGGIFGLLKAAIVLSVILYFFNGIDSNSSIIKPEIKENSRLYEPIRSIVPMILPHLDLEDIKLPDSSDIDLPGVV